MATKTLRPRLTATLSTGVVSAVVLSGIVMATPALANDVTALPSNANGTNQDGIIALVCPNGDYQVWAPVPPSENPDPGAPNEGRYAVYQWEGKIFLGTTAPPAPESFSMLSRNADGTSNDATGLRFIDYAQGTVPGDSGDFPLSSTDIVTVEMVATGTQPNATYGSLGDPDGPSEAVTIEATILTPPPGSGSAAEPYRIETAAQLSFLRCDRNAHYTITQDINLDVAEFGYWLPVSAQSGSFAGVLRGGGHVISGLETPPLTRSDVGLFGRVGNAHIENLTLRSAVVQSLSEKVGVLAGTLRTSLTVRNVTIESSTVRGSQKVGLFAGEVFDGVVVRHSEASGNVTTPNVWTRTYEAPDSMEVVVGPLGERDRFEMPFLDARFPNSRTVSRVGGFLGEADDDGILISQVSVDANITLPNREKPEQSVGLGLIEANRVGGFVGEADGGEVLIEFVSSSATIDVLVGNGTETNRIGGFAGLIDASAVTDVSSFSNVAIGWQGNMGTGDVDDVGGFVGKMDAQNTMARVVSDSTLTIRSTDGSPMNLIRVGGFAGQTLNDTALTALQSTATVEIDAPTPVSQVGGFAGSVSSRTGVLDVFAGSTIASESEVNQLGGFAGLASNRFTGTSLIVAASFDVPEESTNFDPVMGEFDNTLQVPGGLVCTFYDQTLNPASVENSFFTKSVADPRFPAGVGATTAQLQDQSFLERDGCFDFDNVWVSVAGDYPQLRQARLLTSSFEASVGTGGGSSSSTGSTSSSGAPSKTLAATGVSIGLFATLSGLLVLLGSMLVARRNVVRSRISE